ncbi:MAG: 3,4-dihydroxyphenylacetate 2,3-dioxygenase [Solirubrobacteraceae bacterium]
MSTVSELVNLRTDDHAFDIVRVAYVELLVADLDASEKFYAEHLGMIVAERTDDAVYLRGWEERMHHSLVLRQGADPAAARIGFLVAGERDLDALAAALEARGLPHEWVAEPGKALGRTLRAWDPFGYPLEFVAEIERVETQMQRFDLHRGAPLLRFDHVNLHTPYMNQAFRFWTELGFRCSEYISTDEAEEKLTGAWLLRKPSVHDVALTAGKGPRLHHFAYWVGEPAGVLRACDQLAAAERSDVIERGPGRHGVSNAFFVYLRDPDGHRIELYSCDYYTGDPQHEPLRWSVNDPRCRSFWGTKAPDSWYEESTPILGPDGKLVPTEAADVDERDQRTEVMA